MTKVRAHLISTSINEISNSIQKGGRPSDIMKVISGPYCKSLLDSLIKSNFDRVALVAQ